MGGKFTYRLPTEAEWEYAARAGSSAVYSFGNDPSQLSLYGWNRLNSGLHTHAVAQLRSNAFGLYDMHGNVAQMVSDYYSDNPDGDINPQGPSSGSGHVVRGGIWYFGPRFHRTAFRGADGPERRDWYTGFLCGRRSNSWFRWRLHERTEAPPKMGPQDNYLSKRQKRKLQQQGRAETASDQLKRPLDIRPALDYKPSNFNFY